MRISTKHQFIFISTPKACTHSIYQVLKEHYSEGLIEHGFHENSIPPAFRKFFRWTVVRNPYTRAVSLWWSACRLHPPDIYGFRKGCGAADDFTRFITWLSNTSPEERRPQPLMMTQAEWLRPCEPIRALHLESLQEELSKLVFWEPDIKLPRINTTDEKIIVQSREEGRPIKKPPWRELYKDGKAQEAVLKWAEEDFNRFGYPMGL